MDGEIGIAQFTVVFVINNTSNGINSVVNCITHVVFIEYYYTIWGGEGGGRGGK